MIRLINLPKVESEIIACFRFKWDEIPNDVKLKIEFKLLIFSKKIYQNMNSIIKFFKQLWNMKFRI